MSYVLIIEGSLIAGTYQGSSGGDDQCLLGIEPHLFLPKMHVNVPTVWPSSLHSCQMLTNESRGLTWPTFERSFGQVPAILPNRWSPQHQLGIHWRWLIVYQGTPKGPQIILGHCKQLVDPQSCAAFQVQLLYAGKCRAPEITCRGSRTSN